MKIRLMLTAGLLLICLIGGGWAPARDFDHQLRSIVKPHRFSIVKWEFNTILGEIKQAIFTRGGKVEDELDQATKYFSLVEQTKALRSEIEATNVSTKQGDLASKEAKLNMLQQQKGVLEDIVVRIIIKQIKEALAQQGIFNPIDRYIRLPVVFPPLGFKFEKPPYLLVISPRERIESMREITLQQSISLEEMEAIEAKVDKLGVSSLVVELGGLAAIYPSFITNEASLRFTLNTAIEEWLHQYLVFKPLGFLYLLDLTGVSRNYEIATINETLVGMVSKEIGSTIHARYYSQHENNDTQNQVTEPEFDFNREMREIRRSVDRYLTEGQIEQAEEFMEQKRQYLASKGYHIRKLNQAYFAFHGTYADRPTSISPIGLELKELRSQSASLKDFLNTAASMTSRQELIGSIK